MKIALAIIALSLAGCATKQPGGRADFWTTSSRVENDIIFSGVGFRF
jgi:hypothetical protein